MAIFYVGRNMKNVNKIKSGQVLRALRGLVVYRDRLPNDYISWKGAVEAFVGAKKREGCQRYG